MTSDYVSIGVTKIEHTNAVSSGVTRIGQGMGISVFTVAQVVIVFCRGLSCIVLLIKGLGTSTPSEAKSYFAKLQQHQLPFAYVGPEDDEAIDMAFSKKKVEARKDCTLSHSYFRERQYLHNHY